MGTDNCNLFTKVINDSNIVIENKLHVRDFDQPRNLLMTEDLSWRYSTWSGIGISIRGCSDIKKGNIRVNTSSRADRHLQTCKR